MNEDEKAGKGTAVVGVIIGVFWFVFLAWLWGFRVPWPWGA